LRNADFHHHRLLLQHSASHGIRLLSYAWSRASVTVSMTPGGMCTDGAWAACSTGQHAHACFIRIGYPLYGWEASSSSRSARAAPGPQRCRPVCRHAGRHSELFAELDSTLKLRGQAGLPEVYPPSNLGSISSSNCC
jgi:hypothetical protein